MWIVCITSVRHVLTVNGYGGRQTKENEKSWCFKGWETLVNIIQFCVHFSAGKCCPLGYWLYINTPWDVLGHSAQSICREQQLFNAMNRYVNCINM